MASKAELRTLDVASFADGSHWRNRLLRGKMRAKGEPGPILANHANVIIALNYAPEWAGVLAFNEFSQRVEAINPTPWGHTGAWVDVQDISAAEWLQHQGINAGIEVVGQSIQKAAETQRFHPVREYLDGLVWDGTKRLDGWMSLYLGAEPTDYTAAVGSRWLISAVARIYKPGTKADCCLILENKQGAFKSTALRVLAHPYFTDDIDDLGSKDAAMQTRGVWIIEIAELDSMSRGEVSKIKAFMSRSTDRFRPPYGKRLIESPRGCVFAGSVNHSAYLRDETGARRFWPVRCGRIRIEELERDRDQIWAEAVQAYRNGAAWWLDSTELNEAAEVEQGDRYEGDPWDEAIRSWLNRPTQRYEPNGQPIEPFTSDTDSVTLADVLTHAVGKPQAQWTQADRIRVSRSLQALGWERYKAGSRNSREWRYKRGHK
jgi:putative DNA primase/helicase